MTHHMPDMKGSHFKERQKFANTKSYSQNESTEKHMEAFGAKQNSQ